MERKMKETITEKAVSVINELNKAALIMARQMKSGDLNKTLADKHILSAQRKAKAVSNAYFSRKHCPSLKACDEKFRQMTEFDRNGFFDELQQANQRFGKVLKHYAKAVGAEFQTANQN